MSAHTFRYDFSTALLAVGDKRYPAQPNGDFTEYDFGNGRTLVHRRVRVPFENGYQLSITWGSCTYSDNYDHPMFGGEFSDGPYRVECAIIGPDDEMLDIGPADNGSRDTVVGYCTTDDVQRLVDIVGGLSTSEPPEFVDFIVAAAS